MFNYWLLLLPVLTALTALFCVRLPFMLLFRPLRPVSIFGKKVQGVIPALQSSIAAHAGEYVSRQFPLDALEAKINDPANFDRIRPMIEVHIDDFLRNKLKEQMPMISMFIGDKTIVSLKTVFINEIGDLFPKVMGQFAGNLKAELDIRSLVSNKIAALDVDQIKTAFDTRMGKPLTALSATAFVVGLLVGLLEVLILHLSA